ncbi:MAG: DUF1353 domain-containing protein [Acidimicrobiales bacterium]
MRDEPGGLHRTYAGPSETFYDEVTHGPLQLKLERLNHKEYRLLRRFGYRDHAYQEPFICPDDVDRYTTDLASTPWFFQWIVPPRGVHFPAIMLHDALVHDGSPTHIGPKVDREEADRIMRDAMGALGVGFVRRWLAWTGAFIATAASTMQPRWRWLLVLIVTFGTIGILGAIATLDLLDWWDVLPWMGDRGTLAELGFGLLGAVVIPLGLSALWGRRWRAGAIGGIALAIVLHITAAMFLVWVLYQAAEWLARGRTRSPDEVDGRNAALVDSMRLADQVGKGSSTLVDLRVRRPFVRIAVTGPGMLVDRLRLVTDLGILEGHGHPALEELADGLKATSFCGRTGPTPADVVVAVNRQGPALEVDVGPSSMYETVLEVMTVDGSTLEDLLKRTIGARTGRGFVAALTPIPSTGHLERHGQPGSEATDEHADNEAKPPGEVRDATHEELTSHGHA